MAGGKKNALVPPVYNAQTTRKSDGNGVATFVSPLVYAQKPDKLSSDINWGEGELVSITYARYELYEYFAIGSREQGGMYLFYNASEDMIASVDKDFVNVSTPALAPDA